MIAVIADDLTGAAEMGGIGLRHGLRTEIRTAVAVSSDADLLIIGADSRSKAEEEAVEEMTVITRELRLLRPEWVYKKTDSVLRGHVLPELKAHLENLDCRLALLVPANPSLGRRVHDGRYYVHGQPIEQTSFSTDPEFPVRSSDIQDMLRSRQQPIPVRKPGENLPVRGIVLGEAAAADDLRTWAGVIQPSTLLAGAAGFFSAILDRRGTLPQPAALPPLGAPRLYISGSTFDSNRELIRQQVAVGGPVTYMSGADWQQKVLDDLGEYGKAIVAVDPRLQSRSALELRSEMARSVAVLLRQAKPAELIIEGGSTAYAILQQMGLRWFIPEQEFAQGVVRMAVPDVPGLHITVKPGSYAWPAFIRF